MGEGRTSKAKSSCDVPATVVPTTAETLSTAWLPPAAWTKCNSMGARNSMDIDMDTVEMAQ
jgi:hypothetical protein